MRLGPDIAAVAALIGDPARANMLVALLSGQALTAGELAREAGVTQQTASHHIARLEAAGLVVPRKQGRNRYWKDANKHARRLHWAMDAALTHAPGRDREALYLDRYAMEFIEARASTAAGRYRQARNRVGIFIAYHGIIPAAIFPPTRRYCRLATP